MKNVFCLVLIFICSVGWVFGQSEKVLGPGGINLTTDVSFGLSVGSAAVNIEFKLEESNSGKFHSYMKMGYRYAQENDPAIFSFGDRTSMEYKGGHMELLMLFGSRKGYFELSGGGFLGIINVTRTTRGVEMKPTESLTIKPVYYVGYRYVHPSTGLIGKVNFGSHGFGLGLGIRLKQKKGSRKSSVISY